MALTLDNDQDAGKLERQEIQIDINDVSKSKKILVDSLISTKIELDSLRKQINPYPIKGTKVIAKDFTDTVYNYMVDIGILYPDIVIRQVLLETGNFTSNICVDNCNLFGMKVPGKFYGYQYGREYDLGLLGSNRGHASYEDWKSSVRDYYYWQQYMINNGKLNISTWTAYYNSINNFYAEVSDYAYRLKSVSV